MSLLRKFSVQSNILFLNGFVPLVALSLDLYNGQLGANPPEAIIRTTGVLSIIFLVLTLFVTPLVRGLKLNWALPHRRNLGLWSFYYACIHLIAYIAFDKSGKLDDVIADIVKRPFILVGFMGFLLMIPLAATSNTFSLKKLGIKKWNLLHKATYLISIAAAIHFTMIVKSDYFYPTLFSVAIAILMLWRVRFQIAKRRNLHLKH